MTKRLDFVDYSDIGEKTFYATVDNLTYEITRLYSKRNYTVARYTNSFTSEPKILGKCTSIKKSIELAQSDYDQIEQD